MIAICALAFQRKAPTPKAQPPVAAPLWCDAKTAAAKLEAMEKKQEAKGAVVPIRATLDGYATPIGKTRSLVTFEPIAAPCGRAACRSGRIVVRRLVPPSHEFHWLYLACTRKQLLDVLARQYAEGLLSFDETCAVVQVVRTLDKMVACEEVEGT